MRRAPDDRRLAAAVASPQGIEARLFELKTDLSPGTSALAYLRRADDGTIITDTSVIFIVHDYIGDREGTGRDTSYTGRGAYGLALSLPGSFGLGSGSDLRRWIIVDLECP